MAAEGWRIVRANDGQEALRILRAEPVDVVCSDYAMPVLNGLELFERMEEQGIEAVRILCTGHGDARVAEAALNRAHVFRFLVKPFGLGELRTSLRQAVGVRLLSEENRRYRRELETLIAAQSQDLARANGLLESLLQALPAGVLAVDSAGTITRANKAAEVSLGYTGGELVGKSAVEAGVPAAYLETPGEGPKSPRFEADLVNQWGVRRTLLWTCTRVSEADGAAPGGLLASFIDVSDKQDLESELLRGKQEIEAVFDSITDPTYVVDRDTRIVRVNRAFSHYLKKPFQDILGRRCAEVFRESRSECRKCPLPRVFETGKPAHVEWRDGQIIRKVHYFPIFERGHVGKVVMRLQDVTAEREMEHRLLQSEKMASVGQLSAGIAHEINNPVAFMLSNLNRLSEYLREIQDFAADNGERARSALAGERDPLEAWREYARRRDELDLDFLHQDIDEILTETQEGAERIRKIVTDLKTFSHPDAQGFKYADLNQGLESTLNIVWNELKYKCEVVRDYGELPQVLCEPHQINQVFMNLLVNAAQAIEEKGTVTLRTRAEDDCVLVSISDTGVGIPPENVKKVFEPFFTTKPVGRGTGLGLHLSFGIVRKHGGEIRVDSEVAKGTTFTVVLPLVPPEQTSAGQEDSDGGEWILRDPIELSETPPA